MSKILSKIKEIFSSLFVPKIIESSESKKIKHRKKKKIHRKIKHVKRKIHRHIKKHVTRIKSIRKAKAKKTIKTKHRHIYKKQKTEKLKAKKAEPKTPLPSKWFLPKKQEEKETKQKVKYGIPKHHKHEAELKVAEKSTDIGGEYSKIGNKRVQLRIEEKVAGELIEKGKPRHFFFFKSKEKQEKQEQLKKGKEEIQPKPKQYVENIYSDYQKKEAVKKIIKIIRNKKQKNFIITNLDVILEIVNELGSVSIDQLAYGFGMDEKKIEELANILENNNLIEIHYPAFGKAELRKKEGENGQSSD